LSQQSKSAQETLKNVANAALEGTEKTKQLIARRGRSTYLRERVLGHAGTTSPPFFNSFWMILYFKDPGAYAIYVILKAVAQSSPE